MIMAALVIHPSMATATTSKSKQLILSTLLIVIVKALLIPTSKAQPSEALAHVCDTSFGNYTTNDSFTKNLDSLLTSLTSNATANGGFSEGSVDVFPNRVYGLALCRGDANKTTCQSCLSAASVDVKDACPLYKAARIWYDDCQLQYSSQRFTGTINIDLRWYMWNFYNVTTSEWPRFNQSLNNMMTSLAEYAAYNMSALPPPMFSTGEMRLEGEDSVTYALVQCTRDLSPDNCYQCLTSLFKALPDCCNQKKGGRVIATTCNFRYESYRFYNGTSRLSLQETLATSPAPVPSPLPLPPPTVTNTPITNPTNSTDGVKTRTAKRRILAIAIPLGAVFALFLTCVTCYLRRRSKKHRIDNMEDIMSGESLLFDLVTVKNATDDFAESNKLGEGGFGTVYKGELMDGKAIAVKRLSASSGQGLDELKNEVTLLAKLQHRNLVKLFGVCLEGGEKLIIYEYVHNKSLHSVLFDPSKKSQLYWERRHKIIGGIARGMLYLHEESQVKIIHRDLKASNVLLDLDMNPKISDFGLARLFGGDQTQANTNRVVGTFGYMPPEYALRGQFSNKSDVFSFGVLVLEIVTGQRSTEFFSPVHLLNYVWTHWTNGTVTEIIDSSLAGNYPQSEALRCIHIGLLCVQELPSDRPTTSTVVLMLSSYSVSMNVPSPPAFLHGRSSNEVMNIGVAEEVSNQIPAGVAPHTPNQMSITELGPR